MGDTYPRSDEEAERLQQALTERWEKEDNYGDQPE